MLSDTFANLGPRTTINGGTVKAPNGVFLQGATLLRGNGTIDGRIAAAFGSEIRSNGTLTLGDANSYAGFTSDGELSTGVHEVVIHDRNEAVLGSLTQLGDGTNGGTLTAGTASASDTHSHFLVEQGKNVIGRGTVNGHFKNHGHVVGDGTALDERIVFSSDWTVSGLGTFQNTLVLGTFAPGNSPAVTHGKNQAFGGMVEIELGGIVPGSGDDNHDQINDDSRISVLPATDLIIEAWNDFLPSAGDTFVVMTWQDGLDGQFDVLWADPLFTSQDVLFRPDYINPDGTGYLKLTAVDGSGDFNGDGTVDGDDFLVWQNGLGMLLSASRSDGDADLDGDVDGDDFLAWQNGFGASGGGAAASFAVPEPGTMAIAMVAGLCGPIAKPRRRKALGERSP